MSGREAVFLDNTENKDLTFVRLHGRLFSVGDDCVGFQAQPLSATATFRGVHLALVFVSTFNSFQQTASGLSQLLYTSFIHWAQRYVELSLCRNKRWIINGGQQKHCSAKKKYFFLAEKPIR
jgi:hypothetical protein